MALKIIDHLIQSNSRAERALGWIALLGAALSAALIVMLLLGGLGIMVSQEGWLISCFFLLIIVLGVTGYALCVAFEDSLRIR